MNKYEEWVKGNNKMAFDKKRLKTFDYLCSLYNKKYWTQYHGSLDHVFVYCGSLYATNSTVLVKVDYPEFEHLSDYEWGIVKQYKNADGLLLQTPVIEICERQFTRDFFDKFFFDIQDIFRMNIKPAVLKDMLKPFEINNINPSISFDSSRIMLTGHNKDISIRAIGMGCRYE